MTNSVTFSSSVGGDGSTVTDDTNATTGLDGGGWRYRWLLCLSNVVAIAGFVVTKATAAAASAAAALASQNAAAASQAVLSVVGGSLLGTSATSWTPAVESRTFTTQAGLGFTVGGYIALVSSNSSSIYGYGQITAYSGISLTINILYAAGSGAHTDWNICLSSFGVPGKTTLNGASDPTSGQGLDGDFYINTTSLKFFGPKVSGAWPSGVQLLTQNSPTINGGTFNGKYTEQPVSANSGAAYTINTANGTFQRITLTANCTFAFPTVTDGQSFMLMLYQDATGSRLATWPSSVKWPNGTNPVMTTTASKMDKFVFSSDGAYWYGSPAGKNY